jgi:hypothetical protein
MTWTGKESTMTDHEVVSREEWAAAREELLTREKEHTRIGDELARQRRELADCALIRGDPEQAGARYRQSLRAALPLGDVVETSFEVQGVAMSEAGAGNLRRALVLAESVEALRESLGLSMSIAFWEALLERYLGPARTSLGDEYDAVRAEGRAVAFDDAVELALRDDAQNR